MNHSIIYFVTTTFKKKMSSIKVWVPFKFDTHGSQIIHESN